MARETKKKNKSESHSDDKKQHPKWSSLNTREVESHVLELAKNGKTTSEIGMILRDQFAVPDVKLATGKTILKILMSNNMKPEIPEDLRNLIKSVLILKKHADDNKKDLKNKRSLQLMESKIRRLALYYQKQDMLPENWKYSLEQAKMMFE